MQLVFINMQLSWIACILIARLGCTDAQTINDTATLKRDLFTMRNYSKIVRPTENQSQAINVSLVFTVTNINSLNITNNLLVMSGFVTYSWHDELLRWTPEMYGNVTCISVLDDVIWRPQLIQYTPDEGTMSTDGGMSALRLSSDGSVLALSAREFHTSCVVDVFVYPFDQHRCDYTFLAAMYHKHEVTIQSGASAVDTTMLRPNGEWKVVHTRCINITQDDPFPLGLMMCAMNIRRRPAFAILHATVPLALLTALTCMVFLTPPDCGERITVSVIISLAYTVILARQSGVIPHNSITISLYSQLLVLLNAISAVGVAYSIIVVRVCMATVAHVPTITVNFTRTVLRMRTKRKVRVERTDEQDDKSVENVENEKSKDIQLTDNVDITWLDVAMALDRVMFIVIIVAVLASLLAGLCYIYRYKDALSTL